MSSAVSSQHYNKVKTVVPFSESHTAASSGYFGKLTQAEDTRIEPVGPLSEHKATECRTSLYCADFLQYLCVD